MEGKLIKQEDGYYALYNAEGIFISDVNGGSVTNRLSLKNCQAIEKGYDLDELADEYFMQEYAWCKSNTLPYTDEGVRITKKDFMSGAKTIIEILGDKKFSEKDMSKAWSEGYHRKVDELNGNGLRYFDKFIQSLQQTEWNVIVEMECPECKEYGYISECRNECNKKFTQPKLDADGCLILKRK